MTDLERMGEEALERAKALLAKAKGPDADFEDYEEPELPEELDATDDVEDEEERAADHDEEGKARTPSDADEEDEEDEGEEEGKPVAKAVDAVPILAAIEKRLRQVEALEKRLAYMVKALEALTAATKAVAKGYAALAETPVKPKAHRAVVPTRERQPNPGELFSKALGVVKDPMRVAILEHFVNRGDVEGFLANLTPEERAKVLGGEA
jgi:NADH dehydrogenase/NADH:ubiquinone oxidoreductase subunit G